MSMTRKIGAVVGVLLVAGAASTAALAASTKSQQERAHAAALMKLMGADANGVVSKDQFMNYMSQQYDRLNTGGSGLTGSQVDSFAHSWQPMPASCYRANPPPRCL
jgi:hypothetical protein